jgi:hypothetical protein
MKLTCELRRKLANKVGKYNHNENMSVEENDNVD